MKALILDREFRAQCVLDAFESFIWTDRYREPGDFEIYMPIEKAPLDYLIRDYYIWQDKSDRLMVLEDINIESNAESGSHLILSGRSLESILDRRIVAYRTLIQGNLQNGIEKLLNENAINPIDSARRIPELRFVRSDDPQIKSLAVEANLLGDDLLSFIQSACELYDLGFKVIYNEQNSTFDFSLYYGTDRSYNQDTNPWVVFSPSYENLLGSSYYESGRDLKTFGVVAGSDYDEKGQEVLDVNAFPSFVGLDRREIYIDASDVERPNTEVNEESIRERLTEGGWSESAIQSAITEAHRQAEAQDRAAFRKQLEQKGYEELAKTYTTKAFEGQIEAVRQYVYGRDFFLGDIVQVRDQYGMEANSRVTEVVRSYDVSGETITPTFTSLVSEMKN